MIKYIKQIAIWIILSILMMLYFIVGIMLGNMIFPSSLMEQSAESGNPELMLFISCLLNSSVILLYVQYSKFRGWKLVGALFIITFGIQYFMSQIETLWFNDSLDLPIKGIWAIVTGGAIMNFLFSISVTWITGKFKFPEATKTNSIIWNLGLLIKKIVLLSLVVWPLIYFLAGYFIAWQFEAVRIFYSGSSEIASFSSMMVENITSGLYFFQILRGILWLVIASPVVYMTNCSWIQKGIILGLLLSFLGSSQLLLPNPYMPDMVRMGHLLETSSSSFIWGFIIVWVLGKRELEIEYA